MSVEMPRTTTSGRFSAFVGGTERNPVPTLNVASSEPLHLREAAAWLKQAALWLEQRQQTKGKKR